MQLLEETLQMIRTQPAIALSQEMAGLIGSLPKPHRVGTGVV